MSSPPREPMILGGAKNRESHDSNINPETSPLKNKTNSSSSEGTSFAPASRENNGFQKMTAPPMVYISGEEMTRYACELMMEEWVKPFVDTANWEFFDLSCKKRDETDDAVLKDAVAAGAKFGAIFKEPTITPSTEQVKEFGLKKALPSPNGAMRRGWNGISISRDTIHIEGMQLGFKKPVLFDRHAVGGEYGAGWKTTGAGCVETRFYPKGMEDLTESVIVDTRKLKDDENVVVTYHNPLDNVGALAVNFFSRCLEFSCTPYVVTKKTVFKWQEGFWRIMKEVKKYIRGSCNYFCSGGCNFCSSGVSHRRNYSRQFRNPVLILN